MLPVEHNQNTSCSGPICDNHWHPERRGARDRSTLPVTLDARPDVIDFRDRVYVPSLVEVPPQITLDAYRSHGVPILDQGSEGACTGFALATVAHYLLRARKSSPDNTIVSARMLYEMAKRHDEFRGEEYEGSTARGAIKGWHKHGVCPEAVWPNFSSQPDQNLSLERAQAARKFPLGAYFRVDGKDVVAMHAALAEVGVLYATAAVHTGWQRVGEDGMVNQEERVIGGHAFVIVGYDANGFWFQNSWGPDWGRHGFGHISYDDWLTNGHDVWVVRLGAEIISSRAVLHDTAGGSAASTSAHVYCDLRPHIITVCNNGLPCSSGAYANDADTIAEIFEFHFPRITRDWKRKRVVFYAHGGLVAEGAALNKLLSWRQALLDQEIYPIFFVWHTDIYSTVRNMVEDALKLPNFSAPSGFMPPSPAAMLLDDMLEPFVRLLGKSQWDEMKENAFEATLNPAGAARIAAQHATNLRTIYDVEFHFAAHSAGAIFLALFMQLLCTAGVIESGPLRHRIGLAATARTLTLWAPACTIRLFKEVLLPLLRERQIENFALFTLDDASEQNDHCLNLYRKSLLYLVAHALEGKPRVPWYNEAGTPLLGMEKHVRSDLELEQLLTDTAQSKVKWIIAPNTKAVGDELASGARRHGDFDSDAATLRATMSIILNSIKL